MWEYKICRLKNPYEDSYEAYLNPFTAPKYKCINALEHPFSLCRMTYSCQSQAFTLRTWFQVCFSGEVSSSARFTTDCFFMPWHSHIILTSIISDVLVNSWPIVIWFVSPPFPVDYIVFKGRHLHYLILWPTLCSVCKLLSRYRLLPLDPRFTITEFSTMTFCECFLRNAFPLKRQNVNKYMGLDKRAQTRSWNYLILARLL